MKEGLLVDLESINEELGVLDKEIKEYNKKKKEYEELKKNVNNEYFKLMYSDKMKFNLKEVEDSKLDNISKNYTIILFNTLF